MQRESNRQQQSRELAGTTREIVYASPRLFIYSKNLLAFQSLFDLAAAAMLFVRTKTRLLKWNYFFHPFLSTCVDTLVQVAYVKSKSRRRRPRTWYFLISITRNLNFFQYSVFWFFFAAAIAAIECEVNWNGRKKKLKICKSSFVVQPTELSATVVWTGRMMNENRHFFCFSPPWNWENCKSSTEATRDDFECSISWKKLKTFRLFFTFRALPWPRGRKINTCKFVLGTLISWPI